jgi:hypothetical protein
MTGARQQGLGVHDATRRLRGKIERTRMPRQVVRCRVELIAILHFSSVAIQSIEVRLCLLRLHVNTHELVEIIGFC